MSLVPSFEKYEGLGNDFVVLDVANEAQVTVEQARLLCDRRRGVGADGVLLVLPSGKPGADARMRVINSDGSIPEMCGNGLRCVALHVARRRGLARGELVIETDAGLRACALHATTASDEAVVVVDMGVVRVLDDVTVDAGGERVLLTRVDVGNPHAVALRRTSPEELARLGPRLANASVFARGANVEFVHAEGDELHVLVWERGAGATLACGTGACAAVAVARARGMLSSGDGSVRVRLPGGLLEVRLDRETGRATLEGPARRVFAGSLAGIPA